MKVEKKQFQADVKIVNPQIPSSNELEVSVVFTNKSVGSLRLNGMLLELGMVLLTFRKPDGTLIPKGPPPLPPIDNGEIGRVDLPPGESVEYLYKGSEIFGDRLAPGDYQVKFRYENPYAGRAEWTGVIESDWLTFEVCPSDN